MTPEQFGVALERRLPHGWEWGWEATRRESALFRRAAWLHVHGSWAAPSSWRQEAARAVKTARALLAGGGSDPR